MRADPLVGHVVQVAVAEHPDYPGTLLFSPREDPQGFYERYRDWLSRHLGLNELHNLGQFLRQLQDDGYDPVVAKSAASLMETFLRASEPLEIDGYALHDYQRFALRQAVEKSFFFFNMSAGCGKTFCSAAGAKLLLERDEIDLVCAFTLGKLKIDLHRHFALTAGLGAVLTDGSRLQRERLYAARHQVYVGNYEKLWVDEAALRALVTGRRVLWILDEAQRVVSTTGHNKSRRALDALIAPDDRVWPMSASVVNGDPLRYRDVYSIGRKRATNPLGTKLDFERRYASDVRRFTVKTRKGGRFDVVEYDWDVQALQDVRHRVADRTQTARKTDPGIRELFKGLQTIVVPVQMTNAQELLTREVQAMARAAHRREESLMPYYRLLRYICNAPRALTVSSDPLAVQLAASHAVAVDSTSGKVEVLNAYLEAIRESGDQAVGFTHWTELSLHIVKNDITVPYELHHGAGQSEKESAAAIERFKSDPNTTLLWSSDAGSHGINLQNCRYCIQYEPTYSYDDGMQRASRIDRADSYLDGLTNYVLITENSVEERVWAIQQERKEVAAATQGTIETVGEQDETRIPSATLQHLIFGENE